MNPRLQKIAMNTIKSFPIALLMLGLTNCGSSGKTVKVTKTSGFQQSHGPFDSKGNYIESWADKPPRRKFVRNLPTSKKPAYTPPPTIAKNTTPKRTYTPPKSTYTPPKRTYTPPKTTYTPPKKTYTPPKKTVYKKPTPKKPTPKKITPKTKPPISHTVKKGDTLYGLARKYGASVSSIQKANGLKGNSIPIGKRLSIPRK